MKLFCETFNVNETSKDLDENILILQHLIFNNKDIFIFTILFANTYLMLVVKKKRRKQKKLSATLE